MSENNVALGQNIEGGILGEVAIRSGGEIIRVTEESVGPDGHLGLVNSTFYIQTLYHSAETYVLCYDKNPPMIFVLIYN